MPSPQATIAHTLVFLDTPSAATSDLRSLLNDLENDKGAKQHSSQHNETFDINSAKEGDPIEDDLALMLNEKRLPRSSQSKNGDAPSK